MVATLIGIAALALVLIWLLVPSENHLRTHRAFLNYSFGDHRTEEVERISSRYVRYTHWSLYYQCQAGEEQVFRFDSETSFESSVLFHAHSRAWGLAERFVGAYFTPEELRDTYIRIHMSMDALEMDGYHMSDPREGLRFYSVTLPLLAADWDFTFEVEAQSFDEENYMDLIEALKTMIRSLAVYLGQDQVPLSFWHNRQDISFSGYYCRHTGTFEIREGR